MNYYIILNRGTPIFINLYSGLFFGNESTTVGFLYHRHIVGCLNLNLTITSCLSTMNITTYYNYSI